MRADGWPVARREQGWSHLAASLGLGAAAGGRPSALLDPMGGRLSFPPPLPSDLQSELDATGAAPGRGLLRAAAYYEVSLLWRRSTIPAACKRFTAPSPGKGSIAADCVALALEWEPVLESAGKPELFMLWLDRAGPVSK